MSERFSTNVDSVATGTDKTIINLFNPAATPTARGRIYFVLVGPAGAAPGDQAATFIVGRTTAVGTEGSGLTPENVDPAGPAGAYDSGLGVYGAEPTYTPGKTLLRLPAHQRATVQWQAILGRELILAATQNNGAGLKSTSSSSTQGAGACIMFEE